MGCSNPNCCLAIKAGFFTIYIHKICGHEKACKCSFMEMINLS